MLSLEVINLKEFTILNKMCCWTSQAYEIDNTIECYAMIIYLVISNLQ